MPERVLAMIYTETCHYLSSVVAQVFAVLIVLTAMPFIPEADSEEAREENN